MHLVQITYSYGTQQAVFGNYNHLFLHIPFKIVNCNTIIVSYIPEIRTACILLDINVFCLQFI